MRARVCVFGFTVLTIALGTENRMHTRPMYHNIEKYGNDY